MSGTLLGCTVLPEPPSAGAAVAQRGTADSGGGQRTCVTSVHSCDSFGAHGELALCQKLQQQQCTPSTEVAECQQKRPSPTRSGAAEQLLLMCRARSTEHGAQLGSVGSMRQLGGEMARSGSTVLLVALPPPNTAMPDSHSSPSRPPPTAFLRCVRAENPNSWRCTSEASLQQIDLAERVAAEFEQALDLDKHLDREPSSGTCLYTGEVGTRGSWYLGRHIGENDAEVPC
ncbi:hypothetical protein V8C86DRAFT_2565228 [Haematococcus lacustris]